MLCYLLFLKFIHIIHNDTQELTFCEGRGKQLSNIQLCACVCKMSVKGFNVMPNSSRAECVLFHGSSESLNSTTKLKTYSTPI